MTDLLEPTAIVGNASLFHADCRDVLRSLANNSIDSVVTDPPYALVSIQKRFANSPRSETTENQANPYGRTGRGFMGQKWDNGETAFSEEFWAEVLRVLKPGGHVVAFSGTRTYHRMAVAIEDAGFEIRDQLGWVYGSGFPKSHNQHGDWEGWGTALKPAWEPIALARKPLCGTVAANLAEWGVGALNVDGCRVESGEDYANLKVIQGGNHRHDVGLTEKTRHAEFVPASGRWPANIVHDGSDEVLACFPTSKSTQGKPRGAESGAGWGMTATGAEYNDEGSAARFFYCAKASRKDRDEGLEGFAVKRTGGMSATADGSMLTGSGNERTTSRANTHPTVKPTALMQWLCRLITPPGGTILDPFMGSGSTGKAALLEGFRFIGCEREDEYMPIAEARIAAALVPAKPVAAANDNAPQLSLFSEAA